jgi:gentisate 1,2-dioxygenase
MPDTYLDVWDMNLNHERVSMNAGDIMIFRADTVHAGSAYQQENIRIHVYLDSPMIQRIQNRVWFAKK